MWLVWNSSLVVPDPKQPEKLSFTGWRLYWNYWRPRTLRKWYDISVWILSACRSQTLKLSGRQTCRGTLDRGDLFVWIRYLNVCFPFHKTVNVNARQFSCESSADEIFYSIYSRKIEIFLQMKFNDLNIWVI